MRSCLSRAWAWADARWVALHVDHRGFYSLERLQHLHHYISRTNALHNVLVIASVPLPTLAISVLSDCIPLVSPRAGAVANYTYWIRAWITIAAFTLSVFAQLHFIVRRFPQSWQQLLVMTAIVASAHVALHFALSVAIGFPVPFGYLVMDIPWIGFIGASLWVHLGPQLRADPCVRTDLKKFAIIIQVTSSLAVVYPLFYHLFLLLKDNPTGQFFFTFVLPVIKLAEKLLLNHFSTFMEDLQPVLLTFNVEVFNALFVSCCMQNANSLATSVLLMTMDFLGASHALVRLRSLTTCIDVLSAKIGIPREQIINVATDIIHTSPGILQWRRTSISTVGFPNGHAIAGEPSCISSAIQLGTAVSPMPESHQNQDGPGSPSKTPALKLNAVAPAMPTGGDLSRFDSARVIGQLSLKERKKFVKETLKLLRRTEFLLLAEFTEVTVPVVYFIYLNTIYRLPNREYFPNMQTMNATEFSGTAHNIALYGSLQFLSFVLLILVLAYKFRLPALSQLAFALQSQWQCVHAYLVLWIVYALQSSLEHVGTDYTFKFAWLHDKVM